MESNILISIYVFVVGSCVGSFLNVCIYRIPEKKSIIRPGSHCPGCNTAIPWFQNIPVISYIFLKGKCHWCQIPISIRYPAIEVLTGILFLMLYAKFSISLPFFYWLVFTSVLITVSFIDFDHQIIPDVISLPGILIFSSSFYFIPEMNLLQVGLGILLGGGSLYAVALGYYLLKKQEGMGGGDIKLLAMIGAATGVKGVLFTIFVGSFLGTCGGIVFILLSKTKESQPRIPFGPFLSLGAITYIFYGEILINWYFSFLTR